MLEAAFAADPELARYRPWFAELRKAKPYQLEDRVEELFHEKSVTGAQAWNRLFDETMAALKFDVDGEELQLEATLHLLSDTDETKREAAFHGLSGTLHGNERLFTHITNVLAKDKEISDRWRGYKDIADSRHLANSVEREVVDALEKAVTEAYPRLSHRYYEMKAKWFGKDQLNAWDRNAPLPEMRRPRLRLGAGQDHGDGGLRQVLAGARQGRRAVLRLRLDRRAGQGRQVAGRLRASDRAVGASLPDAQLSRQSAGRDDAGPRARPRRPPGAGRPAGHADGADAADAGRDRLRVRRDADLPLACSTRPPTRSSASRCSRRKVEDMLNTVVRQIAFYTFERRVHTARKEGELKTEQLNEIWLEVSRESLGPAIKLNEGYDIFWAYIPHFIHSPFYVYAYAFGDCLVNSLYAQYEKANEGFAERYFELLKAGGSKHHSELLKPFGLDARDPNFWSLGLSMIERLIGELEATDPN